MSFETKRAVALKNAIKSSDFRPKQLTAKPEEVRQLLLGRLMGEATRIHYQTDPADATKIQEGISGAFQFTPADGIEGDRIQAPRLWAPEPVSDPVKAILRDAEEQPEYRDPETGEVTPARAARKVTVEVAFDVYAIRSQAALGYTWKFVPLFQPTESDPTSPFDRIASKLSTLALPAPTSEAPPADPEPVADEAAEAEAPATGGKRK